MERNGAIRTVAMEGIHPHVTSLGGELHYELTPRLTIDDKFRWTSMRGTAGDDDKAQTDRLRDTQAAGDHITELCK